MQRPECLPKQLAATRVASTRLEVRPSLSPQRPDFHSPFNTIVRDLCCAAGVLICLMFFALPAHGQTPADGKSDQPPDLTHYTRGPLPEDNMRPVSNNIPNVFLSDVVIDNTDRMLQKTDTFNDSEPSIAIKPNAACVADRTKCEIVITTFSGEWFGTPTQDNAPLWHSVDGGQTWTKRFTIPPPPMVPKAQLTSCPCDQTVDYSEFGKPLFGGTSKNLLDGTFLARAAPGKNIYTGSTLDPSMLAMWHWDVDAAGKASPTNQAGTAGVDQPWLVTGKFPFLALDALDVAYDFGNDEQVAVAVTADPPSFKKADRDKRAGQDPGAIANAGHRIAADNRFAGSGRIFSLYQADTGKNAGNTALKIAYMVNASTDFGRSWRLTGDLTVAGGMCTIDVTRDNTLGCVIAKADSRQGNVNDFKFGEVNMLMGGVDALATDPIDGDLYVIYGRRVTDTDGTVRDHLMLGLFRLEATGLRRVRADDVDLTLGKTAALPAIAVAANQTVGVLYDTYEGKVRDFPQFDTHLAQSTDFGQTFVDQPLVLFLSPSKRDDAITKQRVLGDYHQLKAVGNNFFGAFTANGTAFNPNKTPNGDPIFVWAAATAP